MRSCPTSSVSHSLDSSPSEGKHLVLPHVKNSRTLSGPADHSYSKNTPFFLQISMVSSSHLLTCTSPM